MTRLATPSLRVEVSTRPATFGHGVRHETLLGEIDANEQNAHRLPLLERVDEIAHFPSWHFVSSHFNVARAGRGSPLHSLAVRETMVPKPTIGILAGMGPRSTGPFLELVVDACQDIYGARHDIDFPQMLICSQPAPFYEDRPIDHEALEAATVEGLRRLESSNVDFIAIACNTVHIYFAGLERSVSVPLLNIVRLAVDALPEETKRVALVAARPTSEAGIFQSAVAASGRTVLDLDWQAHVDTMLSAVRETKDPAALAGLWHPILAKAAAARIDVLLVACLDLSAIVRFASASHPIVDAANCLARALVQRWHAARDGDS
jgi:aspartate racemase